MLVGSEREAGLARDVRAAIRQAIAFRSATGFDTSIAHTALSTAPHSCDVVV